MSQTKKMLDQQYKNLSTELGDITYKLEMLNNRAAELHAAMKHLNEQAPMLLENEQFIVKQTAELLLTQKTQDAKIETIKANLTAVDSQKAPSDSTKETKEAKNTRSN